MSEVGAEASRLRVELAERSYDIVIGTGLLAQAGDLIAPVLRHRRVAVVTDEHVAALYLDALLAGLAAGGVEAKTILLPPGETTKSFAQLESLLDRLIELEIARDDALVAFGGGVIGDIAGFAASVLRRGIDFVQIPTTLLAQVDSAVGGKTAINAKRGKNLIGGFHQPRMVLADVALLESLPRRELLAGYAEVVKYGLLGDSEFFEWLEGHGADLLAGDAALRARAVETSCRAKAGFVAADEREGGVRALLNLGHTFGHALEAETGFSDRLLHGEAVAIGMAMAFAFSTRLGHCPGQDTKRALGHLRAVGLPTRPADAGLGRDDLARLIGHMRQDKKVRDGRLAFVLARGIGEAFLSREVDRGELEAFLATALAA